MEFDLRKVTAVPERRFVLASASADPSAPIALWLRHAGESNRGFLSAALKASAAARARSGRNQVTPASLRAGREEDAAIYARHVVTRWENVTDGGKPVPFDADVCEQFLIALIDRIPDAFDEMRAFASNAENFRDAVAPAEELGKG